MAGEDERSDDFYAVLGLEKECSEAELRNAYKKLALKWHPDRCSASGNKKHTVEAKEKFQEIQEAYSVLSDSSKRFLYDFGVYDKEDENDEQGMGGFIGQMAEMMSQVKRNGSGHDSFEELQGLFVELFRDDLDAGLCGRDRFSSASVSSSASSPGAGNGSGLSHKRNNSAVDDSGKGKLGEFDSSAVAFSFGSNDAGQTSEVRGSNGKSRNRSRRHHPSMTTPDDN